VTLTAISQTDTKSDSIICVSKWLMQRVIQDLESGDLAKEQLILERDIQDKLKEKLSIKDTIISQYQEKESNFHNEMVVLTEMMKLKDKQIIVAKDETKHYKKQRNLFGIGSGLFSILIILIAL
jgi:hypothetical protein